MTLITTLQEIEKEFEEMIQYNHGNDEIIKRTEVFYDKEKLKAFHRKSHIRLLESLKGDLPKWRETPFKSEHTHGDEIVWTHEAGHNSCLSTIHQLIDNAIKSIEV
jgi:hypothetical protein